MHLRKSNCADAQKFIMRVSWSEVTSLFKMPMLQGTVIATGLFQSAAHTLGEGFDWLTHHDYDWYVHIARFYNQ
mgnify:CR=1 FL=1